MIDCKEYRRRVMAEPALAQGGPADLNEHPGSCAGCTAFTQRLLAFEGRLVAALRLELPASPSRSNVVPLSPRALARAPRRWLAMAASVVLGVGIAAVLWLGTAQRSLAADLVEHMSHEPAAWTTTDARVSSAYLAGVLRDAHVRLLPNMNRVSYAMSCSFRNHHVPHLVVQSDAGPVTVMVLAHENVTKPQPFDEQGYRGMIVPMPGHGGVAVITRGRSMPDTERIVASLVGSIQWTL